MELLVVVVIIAILATMLVGALNVAMKNAQKKRNSSQMATLKAAVETYRYEYGKWPTEPPPQGDDVFFGANNHDVVDCLVVGQTTNLNERSIAFINISEFLTNRLGSIISPINGQPYTIKISPKDDRCWVTD